MVRGSFLIATFCLSATICLSVAENYYGTHIARLSELHHSVTGNVFAVDSRTIFIKDFTYDGEGPAAYFYVGASKTPSNTGGFRIRDERGSSGVLKKYIKKDIVLTLPEGKTLRDIKWFAVWCDEFSVNFGSVTIPKNFEFPRPQKIGGLKGIHAVQSDNIVIVDAQTLLIPNFSYDGAAPDAKFWVGRGTQNGNKPSPNGIRISDENGKESPLKRYDRKTIVLTLPGDLSVFDIGHFGVWCEAFTVDFGHVRIPEKINVPPSLKMLGISPQSKLNCEVLNDELAFEVRWAVAGESVVIQLVSKLDDNEYMSFGVSSNPDKSVMVGGDVVVAWVNRQNGKGYAQDYYLEAKSQCSGNRGSCPDTRLKDNSNSIRLLNAAIVNDYSIVTYQRPLRAADAYDQSIFTNRSQAILWAVGPLNQRSEVSYHSQFLKKDKFIDFSRQPFWNCPIPESEVLKPDLSLETQPRPQKLNQKKPQQDPSPRPIPTPKPVPKRDSWDIPPIQCNEPDDGVFYAQIGPTGGKRGYSAITGHVGWGISWYINGLLIPEVNVVRNKTYTFVIEGGKNPDTPANYHPFYITNDEVGGYEHKSEADRKLVDVYAGINFSRNGKATATGVGRICNWTPDISGPSADEYSSFGAYQRSLSLKCEEGEPGIIQWTPDDQTPDTVYYQCFTHRYLGWKINVLDSCDVPSKLSKREESSYVDSEAEPSIRHESKLAPSASFLEQNDKSLIKNHNLDGGFLKVTEEFQSSGTLNKLLKEGIRAAEALEQEVVKDKRPNFTTLSIDDDSKPIEEVDFPSTLSNMNKGVKRPNQGQRPDSRRPGQPPMLSMRPPGPPFPMRMPHFPPPQFFKGGMPQGRRPVVHKRPVNRPPRPFLIPQQSVMVNSYRKPTTQFSVNNYMKSKGPPIALKPMTPVLLLGEPTEIKPSYKKSSTTFAKPSHSQIESWPTHSVKHAAEESRVKYNKVKKGERTPPRSTFKDPFDIRPAASEQLEEASNTGFKADTVIVESGFRPIFRREDVVARDDDDSEETEVRMKHSSISRRMDDFDDTFSEGEKFFEQPQGIHFEPMFFPSPRDDETQSSKLQMNDTSDIEMASDASDAYLAYLPPNDSKRSAVSYDAKAILDTSLLNDPLPAENDFIKLSSKTKQFIKDTPQFAPFTGEIPSDLMLQISDNREALSRKDKNPVISTKLTAVRTNEEA